MDAEKVGLSAADVPRQRYSNGSPRHIQTETAILPDVETTLGDVEKATTEQLRGPPPGAFDPRDNPDGGIEAWLCVLGAWCCLFSSFGWINCIGVFQDYYQRGPLREYSPSTISWIGSLESFLMFIGGPIVGKIYDNYGPRWLLLIGTFLHVFGLMMASLSTEYYQFLLSQGICSPIGASMLFYPALSTVPTWFFQKRGAAFGIIASGSSIGGVILPIAIQRLITEVGFGWAMRIAAFMVLALMIVANLTLKSRIPPLPKPVELMEFVRPLTELPFLTLTIGSFLFCLGFFLPINYVIVEALSHGMSLGLAQYLVSILNAASLFGRTIPGYLADKLGRFNMLVIMCAFTSTLILAFWLPATGNAAIIVFAAFYGFGSGAFVSLMPSAVSQISDVRKIGVRTGTLFFCLSFGVLVGNPIGGALITKWNGRYTGLQIFAGVITMAGVAFIVLSRTMIVGLKLLVKV